MKSVWLWIKRWWWAVVAGLGLAAGLALSALLRKDRSSDDSLIADGSLTSLAKEEYDRAKTEIDIERSKKKVETEVQRRILEDIASEPDIKTQRERYSKWATSNL